MRNSSVAMVCWAVLCSVWVSGCNCGSSGSGTDGGPDDPLVEGGPDASVGVDAGLDAGPVLPDAGVDAGALLDAGTGVADAGADGGDLESGWVLVGVTTAGLPGPAIKAIVHDSTGAAKQWGMTDSSGRFDLPVDAGDMVTFIMGEPDAAELVTYVGVKPNDYLKVMAPYAREVSVPVGTLPPDASGATVFAGSSACSAPATGTEAVVTLTSECMSSRSESGYNDLVPTRFSVIEWAVAKPHAFFRFRTQLLLADAGTTAVDGLSDWREASTYSVELINAPAKRPGQQAYVAVSNFDPKTKGGPYVFEEKLISTVDGGASVSFDCLVGRNLGDEDFISSDEVGYRSVNAQSFLQITALGHTGGIGAIFSIIDLANGLLPRLTSASHDGAAPRPTITWAAEAPLVDVTVGVVRLAWVDDVTGRTSRWTFIVPPSQLTLTAPEIPPQWEEWGPTLFQQLGEPSVTFIRVHRPSLPVLMGYDQMRSVGSVYGITGDPKLGPSALWRGEGLMWMTSITPGP